MSSIILDGKAISNDIKSDVKSDVEALKNKTGKVPGLAVVLVGEDPASQVYVRNKQKSCEKAGIYSAEHKLDASTSEENLLSLIDQLNNDEQINGILVQLPLPKHLDEDKVLQRILPEKDVDGFHPINVGKMMIGLDAFLPCTPHGIQEILKRSDIDTAGKHVVVVGRSNIVGKPIAMMLVQKGPGANATVTVTHSRTKNLEDICAQADIIVAAIGVPEFIKANMVKDGAVVIDVGINRVEAPDTPKGYKLVGDVAYDEVAPKSSAITPVPGGVGPMTIAMLLVNTVISFKRKHGLE